jgi:hypothetical protein
MAYMTFYKATESGAPDLPQKKAFLFMGNAVSYKQNNGYAT